MNCVDLTAKRIADKMLRKNQKPIPPPTADEILDWVQTAMKRNGRYLVLSFLDSRDMGYRKDFLSHWSDLHGSVGKSVKGNTVREVMGKAMIAAGWKRPRAKRIRSGKIKAPNS